MDNQPCENYRALCKSIYNRTDLPWVTRDRRKIEDGCIYSWGHQLLTVMQTGVHLHLVNEWHANPNELWIQIWPGTCRTFFGGGGKERTKSSPSAPFLNSEVYIWIRAKSHSARAVSLHGQWPSSFQCCWEICHSRCCWRVSTHRLGWPCRAQDLSPKRVCISAFVSNSWEMPAPFPPRVAQGITQKEF